MIVITYKQFFFLCKLGLAAKRPECVCGDINAIMGDRATTDIALDIHIIRSIYDSLVEAPKSIHGSNKS